MLTDEGLMVAYAAKKLLFPTAGVFSQLSPGGGGCPLGGSYYQTQSHHSAPCSTTQINRGKRQKVQKIVSQHILQYSGPCIHRSLLNSCKKCLLGVGRCRNWGGGVVIILLLNC